MKKGLRVVVAVQLAVLPLLSLATSENHPARRLAGTCANCHGTAGSARGAMPSLAGMPRAQFVEQMQRFRDGRRPATVMHQLAKGYGDGEIGQLAEHFEALPRAGGRK